MVLSAFLHGGMIIVFSQMFPLIVSGLAPQPDLLNFATPAVAILNSMTMNIWADMISWVGLVIGVCVMVGSFAFQCGHVFANAPTLPITLKDRWQLLAEQDSVIAYADGVIRRLDAAIDEQWPERKV